MTAGDTLNGYRIVEPLGAGGMATVYRAYQPALDRFVAVKVLAANAGQDPRFRERFRREAQTVAALRHPNILVVYDWGEQDGTAYLVSELVEGGTLADRLGTPLTCEQSLQFLRPVASALDYAHERGVVHRDVKPSNVLLHPDGTPVLADFGVARMLEGSAFLTSAGVLVGTPAYMAPEVLDEGEAGPSVDLYALGVMLYEMLTGSVPFTAATPAAVLMARRDRPLPPPRQRNPELPQPVEAVLLKALARTPGDRFQSAGDLISALERACHGRPLAMEATRSLAFERPGRLALGSRRAIAAGVVLAVLLALAGWMLGFSSSLGVVTAPSVLPPHGPLRFRLGLARPLPQEVVYPGTGSGSLRFLGDALEIDAAAPRSGSALEPFLGLPQVQARDFVEDVGLQFVSGAGAVGIGFHGTTQGEDVAWVSTTGQLLVDRLHALTSAQAAGVPVNLFGPRDIQGAPFPQGALDVALRVVAGRIMVDVNGRTVARTRDTALGTGWFDIRSQPFPGAHFSFRVTRLEVFAATARPSHGHGPVRTGMPRAATVSARFGRRSHGTRRLGG